jgi:hypothetical protein
MPVPAMRRTCLRCGRRPAIGGWQCASCREQFREWDEPDYSAVLELLDEDERKLASLADRLDGTGLWAIAKTVWRAQEKVVELRFAIEEQLRRP